MATWITVTGAGQSKWPWPDLVFSSRLQTQVLHQLLKGQVVFRFWRHINHSPKGSDLAGETAAALAAAAMVFSQVNATYAATCLTHAQQLYTFAKQYQGVYSSSISAADEFYQYAFSLFIEQKILNDRFRKTVRVVTEMS